MTVDGVEYGELLGAMIGRKGVRGWSDVIPRGLARNQFEFVCPGCQVDLAVVTGERGYFCARADAVLDGERGELDPEQYGDEHELGDWLQEQAIADGRPEIAEVLRHVFGNASCPDCGGYCNVAEEIRDGWTLSQPADAPRRSALEIVLQDHMAPMLAADGFSRSGQHFTLRAPNGDEAWILAHRFKLGGHEAEFFVDSGVRPVSLDALDQDEVPVADIVWRRRLNAPGDAMGLWGFDLDDTAAVDAFLNALVGLRDQLVDLVDRQNLLTLLRDPTTRIQSLGGHKDRMLALALYDLGPSEELEAELRSVEQRDPSDRIPAWIRQWLADRGEGG